MNTLKNDQNQIGKPLVCVRSMNFNHAPYIADAMNGFCMQKTSFLLYVVFYLTMCLKRL